MDVMVIMKRRGIKEMKVWIMRKRITKRKNKRGWDIDIKMDCE